MKRTIKLFTLAAVFAVFAVPALAQAKECNDENKGAWYKTFYDNFRGSADQQKTAVEAAKTYLSTCPADPNDKQADYMKKFVDKYDTLMGKAKIGEQFDAAIKSKNYADQLRLGKELLASDADNVDLNVQLGIAGLADPKLLNESSQYARKAISLIESGKTPKAYTKEMALAYLNWTIGKSKLTSAPADAISDLLKAAKIESDVKKTPQLYLDLAAAYEGGPRAKFSSEYTASLNPDKTESAQSKVILENLNRVIDNQIDAEARAAALTTEAGQKQALMTELATLFKYRNKTEPVAEFVATVMSKPIPDVPTPITSLPSQPSSSGPGTSGGTGGAPTNGGTTNNGSAKPVGNTLTTTTSNTGATRTTGTATPANSAKPTASPTPMTKKPRLNHRRG